MERVSGKTVKVSITSFLYKRGLPEDKTDIEGGFVHVGVGGDNLRRVHGSVRD